MPDLALHVSDLSAGASLVPGAIELLSRHSELHDKVARQIFRLGLAALLAPQVHQSGFIIAHDDPGVRAADERTSILHIAFPGITKSGSLAAGRNAVNTSGTHTTAISLTFDA